MSTGTTFIDVSGNYCESHSDCGELNWLIAGHDPTSSDSWNGSCYGCRDSSALNYDDSVTSDCRRVNNGTNYECCDYPIRLFLEEVSSTVVNLKIQNPKPITNIGNIPMNNIVLTGYDATGTIMQNLTSGWLIDFLDGNSDGNNDGVSLTYSSGDYIPANTSPQILLKLMYDASSQTPNTTVSIDSAHEFLNCAKDVYPEICS